MGLQKYLMKRSVDSADLPLHWVERNILHTHHTKNYERMQQERAHEEWTFLVTDMEFIRVAMCVAIMLLGILLCNPCGIRTYCTQLFDVFLTFTDIFVPSVGIKNLQYFK